MYKNIIPASLLFTLLGSMSAPVQAEWEVYKFLDIGAEATDNLQLFAGEEVVFSVRPSIELEFSGNRFNSEIIGSVEAFRFNERDDEIIDPRLQLETAGTLIDNLLFTNASLEFGKVIAGDDFFDLTEDSDTQARLRLNPFFARQIGQLANLFVGYGHQSLDNETDGTVDFQQNSVAFSLNRSPRFGGFLWGVGGNYELSRVNDNEADIDESFDSSSIFGSIGYTLGQTAFFEVIGGQEINDFTEIANDDDPSAFAAARLHWTPSERTSVVVGFSDRFFGEGPTLSVSHQVRSSLLTANWTREVSNADVTLDAVTPFSDVDDAIIPTDINLIDIDENATANRLFVDERFSFGYKRAGRRSDLIVDAIFSDQTELGGDATRSQFIGRIAFDRQLSPLTTLRLQYEHLLEDNLQDERDNENRVGLRFIFNFDRKERVSIIDGEDS